MNAELVRIIDSISRDKNIDKESVFDDLEQAMMSAIRKAYGQNDEVVVEIDRITGDITAYRNGVEVEMRDLGRIAAQTAKQVMIQKIREAERGSIYEEFVERKGTVVTGTISRFEGGAMIINLGRAEGFLPKSEQIPGETQHPGERIRCLILDVREASNQVKIVLSRSHPDFIRRLFELEVPEVAERIIEIKALAREAGYRTKIAVTSIDSKVDAVGACVGVRGSRIKNIVVELGGEKIDIVRWNESSQILISNALKPAEVSETALCFELGRATVVVPEDQLSLAIGKRGQNVRLGARLTNWDIDILTPKEYNKGLDDMERVLSTIEDIDSEIIEKMMAMGLISLMDFEEIGTGPFIKELELSDELAEKVVSKATEAAKVLAAETAAAKLVGDQEPEKTESEESPDDGDSEIKDTVSSEETASSETNAEAVEDQQDQTPQDEASQDESSQDEDAGDQGEEDENQDETPKMEVEPDEESQDESPKAQQEMTNG